MKGDKYFLTFLILILACEVVFLQPDMLSADDIEYWRHQESFKIVLGQYIQECYASTSPWIVRNNHWGVFKVEGKLSYCFMSDAAFRWKVIK